MIHWFASKLDTDVFLLTIMLSIKFRVVNVNGIEGRILWIRFTYRSLRLTRSCSERNKANFLLHRGQFYHRHSTVTRAFFSTGFTFGRTRHRAV